MNKQLKKLYYSVKNTEYYYCVERLYRYAVEAKVQNISRNTVRTPKTRKMAFYL